MKLIRKLGYFLLILGVLALGVLFAVQNTATVPLDLLVLPPAERSVALWVLLAFAVGGVIGMLTSIGLVLRLRTSLLRANRRLANVPEAMPVTPPAPVASVAPPENPVATKENE